MEGKHPRSFWLLAALITLAGAALRFYDLGGPSLWIDEVFTDLYARASVDDMFVYLRDDSSLNPLYFLALHVYPVNSDAWLRSFSAVLGVLAIPLFVLLAEYVYADRRLALWAGALLAFNPFHVWLSRTARMYSLVFVLVLIVSYCFLDILRRNGSRTTWVIFVLASSAAYNTHYFTAALPFAQYVVMGGLVRRSPSVFRRWTIAQIIAVIPLLFWFGYLIKSPQVAIPIGWISEPGPVSIFYTLTDMTAGYGESSPWYALPGMIAALVGLAAGLVYAGGRRWAEPDRWYWFWLVVGTLLITFVASYLITPLYEDRYFIVILPGLLMLILHGWRTLLYGRWSRLLAAVLALIILTGAFLTVAGLYHKDYYKEDWRGVATYIAQHHQPGDGVAAGNPIELVALTRVMGRDQISSTWLEEPDRVTLHPFDSPVDRVWVIMRFASGNSHQNQGVSPHARAGFTVTETLFPPWVLDRRDQIVDVKSFNGLALVLVHLDGDP